MTVLGVDWGTRRIGLAVSDESRRVALPAGCLESRGRARDVAALCALARERRVSEVVVGLPLHLGGARGEAARAAQAFADALRAESGLPVETLDERLSSVEAERALREAPAKARRKNKGARDEIAATLLLRAYLALRHERGAAGECDDTRVEVERTAMRDAARERGAVGDAAGTDADARAGVERAPMHEPSDLRDKAERGAAREHSDVCASAHDAMRAKAKRDAPREDAHAAREVRPANVRGQSGTSRAHARARRGAR